MMRSPTSRSLGSGRFAARAQNLSASSSAMRCRPLVEVKEPEAPERRQPVLGIVEALGNLEGPCPGRPEPRNRILGHSIGDAAERRMELHLPARIGVRSSFDSGSARTTRCGTRPAATGASIRGTAAAVSATPIAASPSARRPSRAPRANCRSAARNRQATRPRIAHPIRLRSARRNPCNIRRDGARAVRPHRSRASFSIA